MKRGVWLTVRGCTALRAEAARRQVASYLEGACGVPACMIAPGAHWRTTLPEALLRRLLALKAPELPRAVLLPAPRELAVPLMSSSTLAYAEPRADLIPCAHASGPAWQVRSRANRRGPSCCLVDIRLKMDSQ